ncbi:2,4-diaminobutyrate 4-transaminase [Psychromonas sp. CNPT3]|uniref:diaminobutyrate--2-oxoglutarate transaminase family protein n=1 Tax=Psychromonas sp. CNPT3 TaxID=314282 RepID=UPI0002C059FF|nr:diaminobutyrate--2-oxoglutarate transaminase family protein [Psychromonas sp. CNPT3]AGH81586.1 2,4-diaminobutyrate 4-transaminase [Psychromonas sp. CNPT3]
MQNVLNIAPQTCINNFQEVPVIDTIYDLTLDNVMLSQEHYESEVRSYPRRIPIAIKTTRGVIVEDTKGQVYIDCLAGAGALALGYNHSEINQVLIEQLNTGVPYQTLDLTTPSKDAFIKAVMKFLPPNFAKNARIQFCGPSGSDAVEASIKLAKLYTKRNTMIAFHGAYHGMTNGSLALTGSLSAKERRTGLMSDVHFFPFPYSYRCSFGLGGEAGAMQGIRYLESVLCDDESGITKPAAIIVEPIQGEGGVIPASALWLQALRRITTEHGILLIFDEIQCGIGRSGDNFAFEASGIEPDILILSKAIGGGMPMSVILYHKKFDCWNPGEHTGTFRGNQLAMASGAKTLEIIARDNLTENARLRGEQLREGLIQLQKKFPQIGDVRGRGLMNAMEIVKPTISNKLGQAEADAQLASLIQRAALERGLIIEKGGRQGAVLRFLPPLIISEVQIDFVLSTLASAFSSVLGD